MTTTTPRIDRHEQQIIINGALDFWQRGTSFPTIANNTFTADRFQYAKAGTVVHTVSRSTDVPTLAQSGFQSSYSLLSTVTTAQPSIGASEGVFQRYKVEGYDYATIHGKACRLRFWVKCSVTGLFGVSFQSSGNSRAYIASYTINAANTWEVKTIDLTMESSGASWLFDNSLGVAINFMLAAGTSLQTTPGSWINGNILAPTGQVNSVASNGATFQLAQISLIEGSFPSTVDIPFRRAGSTIQQEIAMCQRYYESSYSIGISWGTSSNTQLYYVHARADATTAVGITTIPFRVNKRASTYNVGLMDSALVAGQWLDHNGNVIYNNSEYNQADGKLGIYDNSAIGQTTGTIVRAFGYWYVDAEL